MPSPGDTTCDRLPDVKAALGVEAWLSACLKTNLPGTKQGRGATMPCEVSVCLPMYLHSRPGCPCFPALWELGGCDTAQMAVQSVTRAIYMYTDTCAYCVLIVYLYLDVYIKYDVM